MALSPSDQLAATAIFQALTYISTNGRQLPNGDRAMERSAIMDELKRREMILFRSWGCGLRSSRKPRWQEELERHSHEYVKAGFLIKQHAVWTLTQRGLVALGKGGEYMFDEARTVYNRYMAQK
jgi:hypothetical protein